MKFGGSSVADAERMREVFRRELDDESDASRLRELALELYDLWQRQRSVTNQLVLQDIRQS